MSQDEKHLAKEFMKRLRSKSADIEAFRAVMKEFVSSSAESRMAVANGLLRIGSCESETIFDRDFALSQLGMLVYTCGLRGHIHFQKRLNDIIDKWIYIWPEQNPPWGALSALGRVNRQLGLEKCDYVIEYYGDSEAAQRIRKLREGLERLNPSEK